MHMCHLKIDYCTFCISTAALLWQCTVCFSNVQIVLNLRTYNQCRNYHWARRDSCLYWFSWGEGEGGKTKTNMFCMWCRQNEGHLDERGTTEEQRIRLRPTIRRWGSTFWSWNETKNDDFLKLCGRLEQTLFVDS